MNTGKVNAEIKLSSVGRSNTPLWLVKSLSENGIIVFIILIYIVFGYSIKYLYGHDLDIKVRFGHHWFDPFVLYFLIFYFAIYMTNECVIKKNISIKNLNKFCVDYLSLESLIGFTVVYFLLNPFFSVFSSLKSHIPNFNYYYADEVLMKIDQFIHFGNHPWEILQPILGLPILTQLLDLLYSLWFFLLFGVCLWMAITRRRRLRVQFFVSFFLIWILLGNALALLFSSGGPCYYNFFVEGHNPYSELFKYLSKSSYQDTPLVALQNQNILWQSFKSGVPLEFGGGISAMPSLHVAIAFLFVLVSNSVHKILCIIFLYYAIFIFLGSIHLGWHYAIDGYVAIFGVLVIWKLSNKLLNLIGYHGTSQVS
jgi:hypothetical protein